IEVLIETGDSGFLGCNLGQRVLYHGVADVLTERDAQLFQLRDGETAVLGQQHSVGVLKPLFDLLDCGCLVWPRHGVPFISRPVRPDTQKKRSTQEGVKRLTPDSERKPAEVSRAHLRGTLTGSLRPRAPGSDGGSECNRKSRRFWVTSVYRSRSHHVQTRPEIPTTPLPRSETAALPPSSEGAGPPQAVRRSVLDDDATVDLAVDHLVEDLVDILERPLRERRVDLPGGIELEGFDHVLASADDRTADRQALEHDVEDRRGEVTRRQTVEYDGPASAGHADRLPEGLRMHGGDENTMRAADLVLDDLGRILGEGVDRDLRSVLLRQRRLAIGDIDGDDAHAHRHRVLHCDVAESADAGDDDPLAGSDLGALECLVDGDAGAQQGRDLIGVGSVGDRGG